MYKTLVQNTSKNENNQRGLKFLLKQIELYIGPLQKDLDQVLDKRLVRTFSGLFTAILSFRNRAMGLLLSELGGYLLGFDKAPAGTKRISNLLRSPKWDASIVEGFLFNRSMQRLESLQEQGLRPLLLWDDSRLEKPESWFAQGLCSVLSSKGKRLTKVKKGFYRPPMSRICVPGFEWTAVMLSALGCAPSVCQMSWWTTRGKFKELGTNIMYRLLKRISTHTKRTALHVMDRGYASTQILEWLFKFEQDFLIRWKKNHLLCCPEHEPLKTHQLARRCKPQSSRIVKDKERNKTKRISIAWTTVFHPEFDQHPLTLLIVRDRKNFNSPLYLLTSLTVSNHFQAWQICFSYFQRWTIEQAFRFGKSELAMESPRLWAWTNRLKFLAIVSLIFDFLLHIWRNWNSMATILINIWCPRTGKRHRNTSVPLYRLRLAISYCCLVGLLQNSG